jgi:hypothetical protein
MGRNPTDSYTAGLFTYQQKETTKTSAPQGLSWFFYGPLI